MSYKPLKEIELVNPVAPVEFFVSNDRYLATLDNWHNRGYGKVVAFYSPDGNHIKDSTQTLWRRGRDWNPRYRY
jgi:hypothetical protein